MPGDPSPPDAIARALLSAQRSSDALAALFQLQKAANAKVTLGFVCRRAGLKSTGHLSDVLTGRRRLGPALRQPLLEVLGVTGAKAEYLVLMMQAEDKAGLTDEQRARQASLRKLLGAQSASLPKKLQNMFFAFEVFAAFGLFGNRARKDELRRAFGTKRGVELDVALHLLEAAGLIANAGDGSYRLVNPNINFSDSEDQLSHLQFLELAIRDAAAAAARWYARPEACFFSSSILSVHAKTFAQALPGMKEKVRTIESDLESGAADQLVRFNVQVYPVLDKR